MLAGGATVGGLDEPDPDADIQALFGAAVGLPDCQGWA